MLSLKLISKGFMASLIVLALTFLGTGCASSGNSATDTDAKVENKVTSNENLTLEDYLRRLNGVQVRGSGSNLSVTIRGNMSISDAEDEPLYVLNGREVGHNYAEVARLVSTGDILSVEAIPASRASSYGLQGGSGVIVIETEN